MRTGRTGRRPGRRRRRAPTGSRRSWTNGDRRRRRRLIKAPVDKAAVRAARKGEQKEVKAEAAERRKTKIKKHLKKKAVSKNKKK